MRVEAPPKNVFEISKIQPLALAIVATLKTIGHIRGDHSRTGQGTSHHFTWSENLAMATEVFLSERGIDVLPDEKKGRFFAEAVQTAQTMQALGLIKVKGKGKKEKASLDRGVTSWLASF